MSVAGFSVRRPVFISMVSCIVVVLGGVALKRLPVDLYPEVDYPSCSIATTYDDASPEEMEELITRPIERQISAVAGIKEIGSSSSEENSNIWVQFNWGVNLDEAVADIRDRIDRVLKSLPEDVDRPTIYRFDSTSSPIMLLGVSSRMKSLREAKQTLEDDVQYRLERIDGVASVNVSGGLDREIHVLLDLDKAKQLQIPLSTLFDKLEKANVATPAGNQQSGRMEIHMRTLGTFDSIEEIENLFVTIAPDGSTVRLRDIADVEDTHAEVTRFVRINGQEGIYIEIYKQSGANTVAVARGIRKELEAINQDMADKFRIVPVSDQSEYIQNAIDNVADTAISGGLLAVLILFIFLCDVRSTLIIAVSIPLSIVATFVLIYFCGYTINIMTLGGLALGVGMLVDNSIVVLENAVRLRDGGKPVKEAAEQGASEVTGALIASTLTTVAVFLPLIFTKGMAGVMFRQLAVVIGFSLLCSLVAALTIVPMLSGLLLSRKRPDSEAFSDRIANAVLNFFQGMNDVYASLLDSVLKRKTATFVAAGLLLAAAFPLAARIGTELMPKTDEGRLSISLEEAVGTAPQFVNNTVISTEEIIRRETPGLIHWTSSAGLTGWRAGHKANYDLKLVPRSQREESSEDIAAHLGEILNRIPGTTFRVRSRSTSMVGGSSGESVRIDIRGYDFKTAEMLGNRVKEICEGVRGVTDAKLSRDLGMPENRIYIDREKAGKMKVSVQTIATALRTMLAGSEAGYYRERGEEYVILVQVKGAKELGTDDILDMTVQNEDGENVALRNLVDSRRSLGPVNIERRNQQRNLTVWANLYDRDLGSAVEEIREKLKVLNPLPTGFSIGFSGDYEDQQETFRELAFSFVLALFLVYMTMACQFESLLHPLIVMFSVPLAGIGVVLMLFLTRTTFNMQSFIGCVMLAGIVVNNAILLVDTANLLRQRDGLPLDVAIRETGRRRLRPILMTTLTTVLGLIPLAIGSGDGGEAQAPLARAVIGGLTSSTLITLFFIPALYAALEGFRERRRARKRAADDERDGARLAPGDTALPS